MPTLTTHNGPTNPGSYLVVLKENVSKPDFFDRLGLHSLITHDWSPRLINGFAGKFNAEQLAPILANPDVASVAEDGIASTCDDVTQTDAPWGLARLSQDDELAIQTSTTSLTYYYTYDDSAGSNVDIYIIGEFHIGFFSALGSDTGVYTDHSDFGGRATWGKTFGGYADADNNGHGTHCAGIAAGAQFGVAKEAKIIAVKVLGDDGTGYYSDVISGLDYVLNQVTSSGKSSVASMSLGGGTSDALDSAVTSLINKGIHVVVAAGNDNKDAKNYSPARVQDANTIGASDIYDTRCGFSNYGSCLDLFAPGQDITSAWIGDKQATNVLSGTSMATPHVSGLIAYSIALDGDCQPVDMTTDLQDAGVWYTLDDIPSGTLNVLASNYSLYSSDDSDSDSADEAISKVVRKARVARDVPKKANRGKNSVVRAGGKKRGGKKKTSA